MNPAIRLMEERELDELLARPGTAPLPRLPLNTHIHLPPNFSAFESAADAAALARAECLALVGTSNYYDYGVYGGFAELGRANGFLPLFGTEIIARDASLAGQAIKVNDPGNPGKIYICGKAIHRFAAPPLRASEILGRIRSNDAARMDEMLRRLIATLRGAGLILDLGTEQVVSGIMARCGAPRAEVWLQERHLCQAVQEAVFAATPPDALPDVLSHLLGGNAPADPVGVQNALRSRYLKAGREAFVEETFITLDEAAELIRELGGVPSYPVLADGTSPVTPFEQDAATLAAHMRRLGIGCVEFIPVRNSPATLEAYVPALRAAGLVVTAGTEHNTLDRIPMTPRCKDGNPVPEAIQTIFTEGACILAAHQELGAHGRPGLPDATGPVDPSDPGRRDILRKLAHLGAELIKRATAALPN